MALPRSRCSPPRPTAGTTSRSRGRRSRATSASTRSACALSDGHGVAGRHQRRPLRVRRPGARARLPARGRQSSERRPTRSPSRLPTRRRRAPHARRHARPPARLRPGLRASRRRPPRPGRARRQHRAGRHLPAALPRRRPREGQRPLRARLARTTARPGHAATLRLSRRAAELLRTGGAAFELTARMPAGRTGRGTVRLRRRFLGLDQRLDGGRAPSPSSSGSSNCPHGWGPCTHRYRSAAAWRASTWTIEPAAPSTSLHLIIGAAPL